MNTVEVFSQAKINLFLAITGRRADGFHDLVSVAAQLQWGDGLKVEIRKAESGNDAKGDFTLDCDDPGVPRGDTNTILRAARAFRTATGWNVGAGFTLEKRVPMGAGLGGGSGNAVAALRALNRLSGGLLGGPALAAIAAEIGSDCALFLEEGPVVIRGRGERVAALPGAAAARLRGRRVLVFKPGFSIPTKWAYGRLAEEAAYQPAAGAEEWVAAWLEGDAPAEELLANGMEQAAFAKFPALPVLLDRLRSDFGIGARMSGSGSACFALLPESGPPAVSEVAAVVRSAWGPSALVVETRLA